MYVPTAEKGITWGTSSEHSIGFSSGGRLETTTWNHVVVTASNGVLKTYKNGVEVATKTDGYEPLAVERTHHLIGATSWGGVGGFFHGTYAFVKIWHGVELQQADVDALFSPFDHSHHFWDFRGCTTGSPVVDSRTGGK